MIPRQRARRHDHGKTDKKNGTFGRLLRYIYKNYRVYMITVIICIIIAAAASVVQTVFFTAAHRYLHSSGTGERI